MSRAAHSASLALLLAVLCLAFAACGDVRSDLITRHAVSDSGCAHDSDCGAGEICGASAICVKDTSCMNADGASGACECDGNEDCTRGELRICDTGRGRCVECVEDRYCADPNEFCNTVFGVCAERCGFCSELDHCDPLTFFCVECLTDADCGAGRSCRNAECSG